MTEISAGTLPVQAGPDTPIGRAYRAFEQEGMNELFARARSDEPVFYSQEIGHWVVTRHADIVSIFKDPERFSATNALNPVTPLPPEVVQFMRDGGFTVVPVQVNVDPPRHTHVRSITGQFLNVRRFQTYEDEIRRLVEEYVDRLEGQESVDLLDAVTYELPARVVFLLMGIPAVDLSNLKRWSNNRLLLTWGRLSPQEQAEAASEMLDYWNYCKDLVAQRMESPQDDYPSALLAIRGEDDSRLTLNDVNSLVFGILQAGHETTTNASTNIIRALLTHREEWVKLCEDPELIPNAVEEGLRFATSVANWRRMALEDVEVGGVTIPAGSNILLGLASANRDESVFTDPDTLDIARRNARKHISFGNGIHMCIGAPLARLELKIVLETLVRRFPGMTLADDAKLDWVRSISFRGPTSLPVHPYGFKGRA